MLFCLAFLLPDLQPLPSQVSKLVRIPGVVVAASNVRAKATHISIQVLPTFYLVPTFYLLPIVLLLLATNSYSLPQCRSCRATIPDIHIKAGLEGYQLPRKCNTEQVGGLLLLPSAAPASFLTAPTTPPPQAGRPSCPLDPYYILPDNCKCVDFQNLKLQESPDSVPHGEMPRHMQVCLASLPPLLPLLYLLHLLPLLPLLPQLYIDRSLVDVAVPGNRVSVIGKSLKVVLLLLLMLLPMHL